MFKNGVNSFDHLVLIHLITCLEELDALPDRQPVKVKWFVPINETCFRFPARVLPPFRMTCKDHFIGDTHPHTTFISKSPPNRTTRKFAPFPYPSI